MLKVNDNLIQDLIISLIKDDLRNIRLLNGLTSLGLDPGDYHLNVSDIIFKLMGVREDDDEVFEKYVELCKAAAAVDIINHLELLNGLAQGIYDKLMKEVTSIP